VARGAAAAAALALLAGCGGGDDAADVVRDRYDVQSSSGDNVEATSGDDVPTVVGALDERLEVRDRQDAQGATFFRSGDDFVAVRPSPEGGSLISVDDDRRGSTRWVAFVGSSYQTGGRFGGPGESNRGGGPGSGK
jgi:hypothetical protein